MRTDDLLALEQSAENLRVVGGTGFLAVIREVRSPRWADVKSGYFDINKSGTAESFLSSSLTFRDEALFFYINTM